MALFGFGKKKEETAPCCGGGEEIKDTCANVKQAVAELGFSDKVINIGDAVQIAKYGVMQA